jgi:hypothetical protein
MELMSATEVTIATTDHHEVTLDGELATETPLHCRCVPEAIEVYVPGVTAPAESTMSRSKHSRQARESCGQGNPR